MKPLIIIAMLLASVMPASAHDVSEYPGNPQDVWDCGETLVVLNKHATRSFDLVFSEGIIFFGPKNGINFKFLGGYNGVKLGAKLNGKVCRSIDPKQAEDWEPKSWRKGH
jgi:hypothetical protein